MPVLYQKLVDRSDLRANPRVLYLFGDNDQRSGMGGQAKAMRGEPNAVGIRTKKRPSRESDAYWHDAQYERNCQKIDEDFMVVYAHLRKGGIVVVPSDGIGTGLSEMGNRCPKTLGYLQNKIDNMSNI